MAVNTKAEGSEVEKKDARCRETKIGGWKDYIDKGTTKACPSARGLLG